MTPMPCPFCGSLDISVQEGSTFRWRRAGCNDCGAEAGEVRCQTLGDGDPKQWDTEARVAAIQEWNRRSPTKPAGDA